MSRFATGRNAYAISDRSGFRYKRKNMRKEWNGSLVGKDEYEAKHPQLTPRLRAVDAQALRNARPDTDVETSGFVVYTNIGDGILGKLLTSNLEATTALGTVTVTTS